MEVCSIPGMDPDIHDGFDISLWMRVFGLLELAQHLECFQCEMSFIGRDQRDQQCKK